MNTLKKLPLGIQTFAEIRENPYCYVDKTPLIAQLIDAGKAYFLSRPRRFGKSLLVDTLKELFEGNQALFKGLFIEDKWDWGQSYPVIKFDFAEGVLQSRAQLDEQLYEMLHTQQRRLNLKLTARSINGQFAELIRYTYETTGQKAVILADEYDKPILDNIGRPERAAEIREGLKNLYSVLKSQDAHIQFVFMTGVTKFSKVSLFSGLNQLQDITLHENYATICGYTLYPTGFRYHICRAFSRCRLGATKRLVQRLPIFRRAGLQSLRYFIIHQRQPTLPQLLVRNRQPQLFNQTVPTKSLFPARLGTARSFGRNPGFF